MTLQILSTRAYLLVLNTDISLRNSVRSGALIWLRTLYILIAREILADSDRARWAILVVADSFLIVFAHMKSV